MAETAKKGKKKKGKTLALTEFLANDGESGPTVSHAAVFSARSTSWADESEGLNTEVDTSWPEDSYGGVSTEKKLRAAMDRASLPTAPRASRGPDIDSSKIPDDPPFTAFLGNLSYDVDKDDIVEFFVNIKIIEVRLPQDTNGRLKGFGYAEFEDKKALLDALTLNNEHLKNRRIRVDVAGQQHQERERGDRDSRSNEPDRTDGDWRSKPVDSSRDQNGYYDRERSHHYDDGPRDRWGHRGHDDGPHRDRSGYRGYDDGPRDRSGYRGYDDGPPRERYGHRGYDDGPGYGSDGPGYGRDGPGYGRDRGYDDGPRSRDFGDGFRDRRGDDYYGDRDKDRGRGFGSGWGHGDRDRLDDRGYDRYDDRGGGYGGRDRYDGRRYGDRRGGDRYESRSGYGRDRDRYDDRGRYGERDRYGDRDHYVDLYGDRDRRRDYDDGDRGFWRDSDRGRDARSDFDRDEREPARERPKLQLKPRSKPAEESNDSSAGSSSVFGSARPVDTAAKEREIEEKLARQKLEEEAKIKQEIEKPKERRDDFPRSAGGRSRRDSNRSSDGERGHRERRDSTDSRGYRDSARSGDETSSSKEGGSPTKESSREVSKENKYTAKEVPRDAPPPAVNVWAKRMEQQKAASSGETGKSEPKSPTEEPKVRSPVQSDAPKINSPPPSPERKSFSKPPGARKDSREFGGPPRGRGRGGRSDRGERSERSSDSAADKSGGRGARKERKERKPVEPKKYDETPAPVFHTASKFSALLSDEDASEQDADQIETEEQGET